MENRTALLSTFATDRLVNSQGELIRSQAGGPALFISQVFDALNVLFVTPLRQDMEVEIKLTDEGEFGRITQKPSPLLVDYAGLNNSDLVISTVLDEYSLAGLEQFKGKVFADVQGYVRDGQNFGQKKLWELPTSLEDVFFCLKAADYEVGNIPSSLLEKQKQKLLLLTRGKKGCTVFSAGASFTLEPKNIAQTDDTLGAGDTFFANFIAEFLKNGNPRVSCEFAMDQTYDFLINKSSHSNQSS